MASTPPGITCGGDCVETYLSGTVVSLTATLGAGTLFDGWTGCDTVNDLLCTVTLTANRTVTIRAGKPVTLAVMKVGTGNGGVVSKPPGIDCGSTCLAPIQ